MHFNDRLYGQISFDEDELKIITHPAFLRLHRVSLSAIPTWFLPTGTCASKFEHSVGVGYLAKLLGQHPDFRDVKNEIFYAALLHDIGTPPFSHTSERYQELVTNQNHEAFAQRVIESSGLDKLLKKHVKLQIIFEYITGEHKKVNPIHNDIDVDNLDNTLRFGMSMGLLQDATYSPEKLANAFTCTDETLSLYMNDITQIERWLFTRDQIYNHFVYTDSNLAPASMLWRALEFAYQENLLTSEYFNFTDEQAWLYLSNSSIPNVSEIIKSIQSWNFYSIVGKTDILNPNKKQIKYLQDFSFVGRFADEIADELKVPAKDVSVFIGKDTGQKKLRVPIYVKDSAFCQVDIPRDRWIVRVYTADPNPSTAYNVQQLISQYLA